MPSRDINDLEPTTRKMCNEFLKRCAASGYKIFITQTFRSWDEQDQLYQQGRSGKPGEKIVTNSKGGFSWHNYGRAFDIAFNDKQPYASSHPWTEVGNIGIACGLEWGGSWTKFPDRPHFQFRDGMTILQARTKYFQESKIPSFKEKARLINAFVSPDDIDIFTGRDVRLTGGFDDLTPRFPKFEQEILDHIDKI